MSVCINSDIEKFDIRKAELEEAYFGKDISGIRILKPSSKTIEEIIEGYLLDGNVNEDVFAWKVGRLEIIDGRIEPVKKQGNYLNEYGITVSSEELITYINIVNNMKLDFTSIDEFENVYNSLLKGCPNNFGTVNIINFIYFKSKQMWPIYYRFAHKAAKAIFMGKNPSQIYVGEAPAKNDVKKVVNMYMEYIWLLEKLFGTYSIDRQIDRALWAYGHASDEFRL